MFSVFERHLYHTSGESGIIDLVDRSQIWLEPLTDAWRSRSDPEGFSRFVKILGDAITALDTFDLRPQDIRLRPCTGKREEVPVGVICKLTRAWVEYLAEGDERSQEDVLEALGAAGAQSCAGREFELGFRAALAEFLIEKGAYELAAAAIDKNLMIQSVCPYSQNLLYRALLKQKEANIIAGSSRISLDDLSNRFCEQPFITISTMPSQSMNKEGSEPLLFACQCPTMLPYPITGISSRRAGEEIESIWNGSEIKEIRRSVLDGDFSYCSRMNCSFITSGSLPKKADVTDPILRDIIDNKRTDISSDPRLIVLSHDLACNLSCPSCRTEIIATRQAARDEMDRFVDRFILPLMEDNPSVVLSVAGNGDPFGSKHYRRLLQNLDPARHAGVALALQCNGLLLTPREWESLSHLHHLIGSLGVSIDAAEPATYENLRRPGKWSVIVENMEFLSKLRREGKIGYLWIRFVVQNENFEQMPAFVELGQRWSVDKVWFEKLSNFGTFNADDFEKHSVTDSSHPNHSRFLEVLRNPILRSKEVDLFNVASYLDYFSDAEVMTTP